MAAVGFACLAAESLIDLIVINDLQLVGGDATYPRVEDAFATAAWAVLLTAALAAGFKDSTRTRHAVLRLAALGFALLASARFVDLLYEVRLAGKPFAETILAVIGWLSLAGAVLIVDNSERIATGRSDA